MMESFLSTLAGRHGKYPKIRLEQLFCKEPVNACFSLKELHGCRYHRSFKNTQGGSLYFVGLQYTRKELHSKLFLKLFRNFLNIFKEFG